MPITQKKRTNKPSIKSRFKENTKIAGIFLALPVIMIGIATKIIFRSTSVLATRTLKSTGIKIIKVSAGLTIRHCHHVNRRSVKRTNKKLQKRKKKTIELRKKIKALGARVSKDKGNSLIISGKVPSTRSINCTTKTGI